MLIDQNRLNSLRKSEEDEKWFQEMIQTLLENMESRLKNIQKAMDEKNDVHLQREFHQIKGMSLNFGLVEIGEKSEKAESLLKSNNIKEAKVIANNLKEIWEKSKEELMNFIKSG